MIHFKRSVVALLGIQLVTGVSAIATDKPDFKSDLLESPYAACKGIALVDESKYKGHEKEWQDFGSQCGLKIQTAYSASWAQIKSLDAVAQHAQYQNFLEDVTNLVAKNAAKSADYAEFTARCFESPSWNAQCQDRMKQVMDAIYAQIPELRHELSLTRPGGFVGTMKDGVESLGGRFDEGNPNFENFQKGLPNIFGGQQLSQAERVALVKELQQLRQKANEIFQERGKKGELSKRFTPEEEVNRIHKELQDEHKTNYLKIVYGKMPIFAVLDAPREWRADGTPIWGTDQMKEAFMKLAKNAREEVRKAQDSKEKKVLEYGSAQGTARWIGEAVGTGVDKVTGWVGMEANPMKEQNDLLYYISYKNQVEELLRNNPDQCAIATTMARRAESKSMHDNVAGLAASFVPGFGLPARAIGKAGGAALRVGRALTGVESAALSGTAMGAGFLGDSFAQYHAEVNRAASRSGTGGSLEGGELGSIEKIEEKRVGVALNTAFGALGIPGAFKLGSLAKAGVVNQIVKASGVDSDKAMQLMQAASNGDQKAQDQVNDLVRKGFTRLFGKTGEEVFGVVDSLAAKGVSNKQLVAQVKDLSTKVAKLEREQRKGVYNNARDIIQSMNPEAFSKMSPEQVKKLNRDIVAVARYGKIEDPKKIAEIVTSWEDGARAGLVSVYDSARQLSETPEFQKIADLKARREAAFKKAIENKGVKDPAEVQQMCVCSDVCHGSGRAVSRAEFDLLKLDQAKVCVMNDATVWLNSKI